MKKADIQISIVFIKAVLRKIKTHPITKFSLRIIFFSYIRLLRPILIKSGIIILAKSKIIGGKNECSKTLPISEFNKGRSANKMQKTIKNIIIDGFGLIRGFKNIILVKKYINLQL
tara:strand:+ start:2867 stop:3214 length:348 start_codon:yes stop_codon:yes gene_type:complete